MRPLSLTPALRRQVDRYAESHRDPVNKALHFVGIPALAVAALGLLARAALPVLDAPPAWQPNAAWPAVVGACVWYVLLDRRVGLLTCAALVACYAAGSALPVGVLLGLFAGGVGAHLVGHYGFEGKPPAVFKSPVAVFEAPAWLVAACTGAYR